MLDLLKEPWPWYIAGPLIGLMVPLLLLLGNKQFGISSSMKHFCAACVPVKSEYFNYDWKGKSWNLVFVLGILLGGFIGGGLLENPEGVEISASMKEKLKNMGVSNFSGLLPTDIFSWKNLASLQGLVMIVVGGFLVGFGSRYANGCTSGHSIMGISMLNIGSVVATVGFFIGGLLVSHFLLPIILNL